MKALNKHIEHESNPIFKDAVNHAQASELTTEDNEDKQEYEKFIELKNLRESLTTHNYQHYYIHLDDSLDKLIGRTEANSELKEENSTAYHHKHEQVNQDEAETANQVDIQNALQVVEDVLYLIVRKRTSKTQCIASIIKSLKLVYSELSVQEK